MRFQKLFAFALLFFSIGVNYDSAEAADINLWHHLGAHPLSLTGDGRDEASIACAVKGLNMPPDVERNFRAFLASGKYGETVTLQDGDFFSLMTYEGCNVEPNVQVAFGADFPVEKRHAEHIVIIADSGEVWDLYRPGCNNWTRKKVPPPAPPSHCFRIRFNYPSGPQATQVMYRTAAELQATGQWNMGEDRAYLNSDTRFAFIDFHMDLTDKEVRDLESDTECTAVIDETGIHHTFDYRCELCVGGEYPPEATIAELADKKVFLPSAKPHGSFRIACANGKCEVRIPIRYAARFGMPCVEVVRYDIRDLHTLPPRAGRYWKSDFYFDLVTVEEGMRSLKAGKHTRGDIYLLDDSGRIRSLNGEHAY